MGTWDHGKVRTWDSEDMGSPWEHGDIKEDINKETWRNGGQEDMGSRRHVNMETHRTGRYSDTRHGNMETWNTRTW